MREDVAKTRDSAKGLPVYYTEWNISSNPRDPLHDEAFAATYAAKIIMEATGLVEGYAFGPSATFSPRTTFHLFRFRAGSAC